MTGTIGAGDSLLIVDVQKDFLPGGALPVRRGEEVVAPLREAARAFARRGLPVFASRDWHPAGHVSFEARGGPWPPHCVQNTEGAEFADGLDLPEGTAIVSKGTRRDRDAYSAFEDTGLAILLHRRGVRRLFVGGLATEVCVLSSIQDALEAGFDVVFLEDGSRGIDPDSEKTARRELERLGVRFESWTEAAA